MARQVKFGALPNVEGDLSPSLRQFLEAVRERLQAYEGATAGGASKVIVKNDVGTIVMPAPPPTTVTVPDSNPVVDTHDMHSHSVHDVIGLQQALDIAGTTGGGGGGGFDGVVPPGLHSHSVHDVAGLKKEIDDLYAAITAGGTSDADAIHDNVANEFGAITAKTSPVAADTVLIEDSADSWNKKVSTIAQILAVGGEGDLSAPNLHPHNMHDVVGLANKLDAMDADIATALAGSGVSFFDMQFIAGLH